MLYNLDFRQDMEAWEYWGFAWTGIMRWNLFGIGMRR